jgi:putative membrane protein
VDLLPTLPVVAGAAAYGVRVRTLARRGRPPGRAKQAWFGAGIVALLGALALPEDRFSSHMSQHLLLGDIGPLLIVLGLDGPLLRPLLAVPGIQRLRALAHPVVALTLWLVALGAWHLAGPYDAALRHGVLHAAEHFSFFLAGALVWSAIVEPLPGPVWFGTAPKAAYALVMRAAGMALASIFIWSDSRFYERYSLHDQHVGGLIMFTEGGIVTLIVFAWLFLRWWREAELRQQLIEQGHDPVQARRTARHWPPPQQRDGQPRSAHSRATRDRASE